MNINVQTLADLAAPVANAIVGGPFGSNLVSKDYVPKGVPVIRGQNMGGKWVAGEFVFVSPEKASELAANKARPGDLVFTQRGTLGQVSIVPSGHCDEYIVSQSQMKITPDPTKADVNFLYYLFKTEVQQNYIFNSAIQTGVPHTNLGILKKTPVSLPPVNVQEQIAAVLSAFDNRIDLLRETNATLEAIAQTLFKSWFVDFDPVRAKAEGREPEGTSTEIAGLFPNEFEESELGAVPKGWTVRSLDDVADYLNGLALQKFPPKEDSWLPVIKIAQLRKGDTIGSDRAGRNLKPEYIIQDGDVLFSWSGSLEVAIWCGGEGALNQHLFKVTSREFPKWFYYFWTRHHLAHFQQVAASKATTMGHIQRKHLTEAKVVVPPMALIREATTYLSPLLDLWVENSLRSRALVEVRDALLPRLISGRIPLSEAEVLLQDAA
ncbi:restriction endonuclease subunit S [Caballeronia sp. GACF4]|uniref:restriction endonuclease subunit S n=1 Tax=Caballeronia sp. GACF4 TaxID=2921763 RepID=UPI00202930B5|nr:restriction endonuclease subunit S [Caballeronia sp. GACF4]